MVDIGTGVFVQNLYHKLNLSSNTLIFWPASLSRQCLVIQHIVGNTQSPFEVSIYEDQNEAIETSLLASKTTVYPKLLLIANGCVVHTSFTNLPDEFQATGCHYIWGICGLLYL